MMSRPGNATDNTEPSPGTLDTADGAAPGGRMMFCGTGDFANSGSARTSAASVPCKPG